MNSEEDRAHMISSRISKEISKLRRNLLLLTNAETQNDEYSV